MRVAEWFNLRGKADPLEQIVGSYEASVGPGLTGLVHFWEKIGPGHSPTVLAALVKADMQRRFKGGERPKILDYLEEFPVLGEDHDRVVSLVYDEFCLLEENGERPDSDAFCDAYSRWRDSLHSQLDYHRELSRAINAEIQVVDFPEPGDRFDRYRLTSLLGVGGVARVYLATEEELGDRQIAIKVSASFGQEPSILAQLDHRNIVPIFTVAKSDSGLRGMCMPYRPGVTLEEVIRRIGRGKPPRSARGISNALRPAQVPAEFFPERQTEGWSDFPIHKTFPEAVAWLGLAMANALSYMHQRGIFHRDIKPANILLALREGPQLLDFNLAQFPSNALGASAAQKGGTLPYSAPEQLKAFLDPAAWDQVGPSADLYSLGLVLRELLTGRPPELPASPGSGNRAFQSFLDRRLAPAIPIGEINPGVPPALESIVDKCLAFRPEDRHATADELAADLQRFLERKPLVGAPNTSRFELGVNWIYRNRKSLLWAIIGVAVVASLASFFPRGKPEKVDIVGARFSAAERFLDSGSPRELKLAREQFASLHDEFPGTARSSLGLALTLLKQGETKNVNQLLDEAAKADDALPVIRRRIVVQPRSDLLHRTLGLALLHKDQKELARESFERSIEIDPSKYSHYVYLAKLDADERRFPEAAGHLEKALEFCEVPTIIHMYRKSLLEVLVNLIDERLEEDRPEAEKRKRQLESQWLIWRDEVLKLPDNRKRPGDDYDLDYFEGCLKSIQGELEADPARARPLFGAAEDLFNQAERIDLERPADSEAAKSLKKQRLQLSDRRTAKMPPGDRPAP